jgi:hypothetical protein
MIHNRLSAIHYLNNLLLCSMIVRSLTLSYQVGICGEYYSIFCLAREKVVQLIIGFQLAQV